MKKVLLVLALGATIVGCDSKPEEKKAAAPAAPAVVAPAPAAPAVVTPAPAAPAVVTPAPAAPTTEEKK